MLRPLRISCAYVFASMLAFLSLSCANKPTSGGPGNYRGVIVGVEGIGTLDVTVTAASGSPFPASGTISFGATTVSLAGELDQSGARLSLASANGYQLSGDSRPTYTAGTFTGPAGSGTFALLPQKSDSDPVQLFCGSFVSTSTIAATPGALGVVATPSGSAICVGPNFTMLGSIAGDWELSCQGSGGEFFGDVAADGGNQWGTTDDSGSWIVAPCGSAPDGGVDAGVDAGATMDTAPDATPDSPAVAVDAIPDAGVVPAIDAAPDAGAMPAMDGAPDSPAIAVFDAQVD
jgi:hypothetical protein